DAFDKTEHPGELSELHERRKSFGVGRIIGQLTIGGGQQMRLADAETTVQIQPDTGRGFPSAEKPSAAATAFDGPLAKLLTHHNSSRLTRLGRVGVISRETRVGESRRRRQLSDQPFR